MDNADRIILRRAEKVDSADLLDWRNDPQTRANSRNTEEIEPGAHAAWLGHALADPTRRIWIAERGAEKLGTVSAFRDGDGTVELSITVAPSRRGRGDGTSMIRSAIGEIAALWPDAPITATLRIENEASRRLFERCGFEIVANESGFLVCRYRG